MRRILLIPIVLCLSAGSALAQCGPRGCPLPPAENNPPTSSLQSTPTRVWRYERAVGHRAAVVRITCRDGGAWSKGSGVLVRWGKRIVVLTARHVVKDAKTIYVEFHNRRRCKAKVLKADARWDCAVLDIGAPPEGIAPAEMAFGADAAFKIGDRLESCGYGHDGKLACNSGLFGGYRRSAAAPNGPDDWMIVSGLARQGDSGGPVFDRNGRVAGILWGTDGREVVCVQPGRIHALLDKAVAENIVVADQVVLGKPPLLPWRGDAEKRGRSRRPNRTAHRPCRTAAGCPRPAVGRCQCVTKTRCPNTESGTRAFAAADGPVPSGRSRRRCVYLFRGEEKLTTKTRRHKEKREGMYGIIKEILSAI